MASQGTDKKLVRVRPPRKHEGYQLEVGDVIERADLPFRNIGLTGVDSPDSAFLDLNTTNIAAVLQNLKPTCASCREKMSGDKGNGDLKES